MGSRTHEIVALARHDREAAARELGALAPEQQVALVCETPVADRGELLALLPQPEAVVPQLPEAELCFTVKAVGLHDAGWILEHASDEQLQSCVDLDAWAEQRTDPATLGDWLESFADAGDETLLRASHAIDPELLMLWLTQRLDVILKPNDDPGWQPPAGGQTIDGQFYVVARAGGDDLAVPLRLLSLLFEVDYWFYFRILQSVTAESLADNEEWALRWRSGRLQDLGFPTWEEAMSIYGKLRDDERELLPGPPAPLGEWHLPVWIPELPAAGDPAQTLLRAAGELEPEARRAFFYAFVALVNKVAVAERLPLGDAESTPKALERAVAIASRGLDWLAERHGLRPVEVLRRTAVDRLFRVGASLDRADPSP
ncbi:MAG: DUF6178 family protein [Myxococcota bacterium]|nr:DUF6178 family protein [Myxococcota bacterium]